VEQLYRRRAAAERGLGRLKNGWALLPLRVRGIERVRLHADLTILVQLATALAKAPAVPLATSLRPLPVIMCRCGCVRCHGVGQVVAPDPVAVDAPMSTERCCRGSPHPTGGRVTDAAPQLLHRCKHRERRERMARRARPHRADAGPWRRGRRPPGDFGEHRHSPVPTLSAGRAPVPSGCRSLLVDGDPPALKAGQRGPLEDAPSLLPGLRDH
jgi:hypothetical protein